MQHVGDLKTTSGFPVTLTQPSGGCCARGLKESALSRCGNVPMTSSTAATASPAAAAAPPPPHRQHRLKIGRRQGLHPSDPTTRRVKSEFVPLPSRALPPSSPDRPAVRQWAASNREPPPRTDRLGNDLPSELLTHSACSPGSIAAGTHSTHSNWGNLTGSSRAGSLFRPLYGFCHPGLDAVDGNGPKRIGVDHPIGGILLSRCFIVGGLASQTANR